MLRNSAVLKQDVAGRPQHRLMEKRDKHVKKKEILGDRPIDSKEPSFVSYCEREKRSLKLTINTPKHSLRLTINTPNFYNRPAITRCCEK